MFGGFLSKSGAKVQKIFDIRKFLSPVLQSKIHKILYKDKRKNHFVQTHLNNRKSIFEICREKSFTFFAKS